MRIIWIKAFNSQDVVLVFPEKTSVGDGGNHAVKGVADTEHQGDADQRRRPRAGQIQNEKRSVIDGVGDYRLEQHIVRLASAVKGAVKHVLKGVKDVKAEQDHNEFKQFVHVGIAENVLHKRLVCRDQYRPQHADGRSDGRIPKRFSRTRLSLS